MIEGRTNESSFLKNYTLKNLRTDMTLPHTPISAPIKIKMPETWYINGLKGKILIKVPVSLGPI
jgi:hypothetical protein